jgi:hypothetical protein
MPYTITCRYHDRDHTFRHPQEWKDWNDAAGQLGTFAEELVTSLSSPLSEAEKSFVRVLVAEAVRTGVAVVPGQASYHVTEVNDAPPLH